MLNTTYIYYEYLQLYSYIRVNICIIHTRYEYCTGYAFVFVFNSTTNIDWQYSYLKYSYKECYLPVLTTYSTKHCYQTSGNKRIKYVMIGAPNDVSDLK